MKNNAKLLKIEELVEKIELLKFAEGIETFRITEVSDNFGTKKMLVHNLTFEIEKSNSDTFIMATDLENKILDNNSPLLMFLLESIVSINGLCIVLKDVTINIEPTDIQYQE